MRFRAAILAMLAVAALAARPATAQQVTVTADDYARAEDFLSTNTAPLVFGATVRPTWLPGDRLWYRNTIPDGAEFVLVGHRSTAWYSGSDQRPPTLVPAAPAPIRGGVADVLDGIRAGEEPGIEQLVTLFGARGAEVVAVADVADALRQQHAGDALTWVASGTRNGSESLQLP